jgi:hypothetical protein
MANLWDGRDMPTLPVLKEKQEEQKVENTVTPREGQEKSTILQDWDGPLLAQGTDDSDPETNPRTIPNAEVDQDEHLIP